MSTDPTLYEDGSGQAGSSISLHTKDIKSKMTLDFKGITKRSHEIGLQNFGSPDLEVFLVQQNGTVTLTPTTQILFPNSVTEEQEEYAQGFIQALEELHKRQGVPTVAPVALKSEIISATEPATFVPSKISLLPETVTSKANGTIVFDNKTTTSRVSVLPPAQVLLNRIAHLPVVDQTYSYAGELTSSVVVANNTVQLLKEEPQIVPCLYGTPPESPSEERLEIKRARNRLAAQKCRSRKLERIAVLSDRVQELKNQNNHLAQTSSKLKEECQWLKQHLMQHVNYGCRLMTQSDISS